MENSGQTESSRHRADQYKSVHAPRMMPHSQIKDHRTINLMAIITERDVAIQQRNQARSEKEAAFTERNQAILALNVAMADRDKAIMERDEALRAVENARKDILTSKSTGHGCPSANNPIRDVKHIFQNGPSQQPPELSDAQYDHARQMHTIDATPVSVASDGAPKIRKLKKLRKESNSHVNLKTKTTKSPRKNRKGDVEVAMGDLNKQVKQEWKEQDLGLNQVVFDDSTMPAPVCSCTGTYRQCYKWGNGGWQSSCCTTTMSMFPLPVSPNKRHARVGGRKMSASAFSKLLNRLAAEGHDLSIPLDLRDHWAKHGTNRYITIK